MNNLTVIESGLVPVYQGKNGQIVDARELHEFLESKRQFADWIKDRIQKYGFIENEDYVSLSQKCEGNNATRIDYSLTIDTAKEISMVENNEQGRKVRKYFIEVENRSRLSNESQRLRFEAMHLNAKTRQAKMLNEIALNFQNMLSNESVHLLIGGITEIIMGRPLLPMPIIEKTYSATEIGLEIGVTANRIGITANDNNLKTDHYGITVLDKSPYSTKQVPTFRYNERGREKLKELLVGVFQQ